jgi:hypothetical protein
MDTTHLNYFVVGAANFIDSTRVHAKDVPPNSLKFFWAGSILHGGFGLAEVNNSQLIFSFIDHTEKTLYQTTMKPRF